MKYFYAFAFVGALGGVAACSSDPVADNDGGGAPGAGGTSATGGGTAAGGTTGAGGGSATGGAGTGGSGNATTATCPDQTYAAVTDPPGACSTSSAPTVPQIADFESSALGWGVYANGTTGTTTVPAAFAEGDVETSAGGPVGSVNALNYAGSGFDQGLRFNVGYGAVCQDVSGFDGLSFWAKGTVAAATTPYEVDANVVIVKLGSQKTLPEGENGDCTADCGAHPDYRQVITTTWTEYRIPFDCFGDGTVFDGHLLSMLLEVRGDTFDVSIDNVGYYTE